jgi:CheY-like chemotaxis protein
MAVLAWLRRALVIDDDPIVREVMATMLRQRGAGEVVVATGAVAAAEALRATAALPDLIVTDLNMPEGDGIELLIALKERQCKAPIVIVTGARAPLRDAAGQLGAALELAVLGVLAKPIDAARLDTLLAQHTPA